MNTDEHGYEAAKTWGAVEERSGDTAIGCAPVSESGVALRFPPQSKGGGWPGNRKASFRLPEGWLPAIRVK